MNNIIFRKMKKTVLMALLMLLSVCGAQAQVQQGNIAVGAKVVYGSLTESFGFGGRFQYGLFDNVRLEGNFNCFAKHKHISCWDLNMNAEYLLGVWQDKVYLYPIAGMNVTFAELAGDDENHVGLNLGAGVEYEITEHIGVSAEYRHTIIKDVDQGVFGIGVNYKF